MAHKNVRYSKLSRRSAHRQPTNRSHESGSDDILQKPTQFSPSQEIGEENLRKEMATQHRVTNENGSEKCQILEIFITERAHTTYQAIARKRSRRYSAKITVVLARVADILRPLSERVAPKLCPNSNRQSHFYTTRRTERGHHLVAGWGTMARQRPHCCQRRRPISVRHSRAVVCDQPARHIAAVHATALPRGFFTRNLFDAFYRLRNHKEY